MLAFISNGYFSYIGILRAADGISKYSYAQLKRCGIYHLNILFFLNVLNDCNFILNK